MAKQTTFSKLFGHSPFGALQSHMRVVLECAREVMPLIENLATGDSAKVSEIKNRIFEREAAADEIKHQLRLHLPKSLFMPVDRRDLLEVLHELDLFDLQVALIHLTVVPLSDAEQPPSLQI